jgi:2,4-dienoyl-CoA reductase (NADPH2)
MAHWGVGDPSLHRGGLTDRKARPVAREVTLVQRKTTPIGVGLGKTSGWAHRAVLKQSGVRQVSGASYDRIEDTPDGVRLHLTVDGEPQVVEVDHVVVCAGQESVRDLAGSGRHVVGGADVAAELDAKRAIRQATEVVAGL